MGDTYVISGFRQKRARVTGEITHAREIIAQRTEKQAAIDPVLRLFAPDCDPDMIPPIKPASHGLFFRYRKLGRICVDVLRQAGGPVTLDRLVAVAIEAKGLPDDKRLQKHCAGGHLPPPFWWRRWRRWRWRECGWRTCSGWSYAASI